MVRQLEGVSNGIESLIAMLSGSVIEGRSSHFYLCIDEIDAIFDILFSICLQVPGSSEAVIFSIGISAPVSQEVCDGFTDVVVGMIVVRLLPILPAALLRPTWRRCP